MARPPALLYAWARPQRGRNVPAPEPKLSPRVSLIVVAAGRGARFGGVAAEAISANCAGKPMLCHTLEALAAAHEFVAIDGRHPSRRPRALRRRYRLQLSEARRARLTAPALGGASRQASVRLGLEAQRELQPELVLIHDGARPFPSPGLVARAIAGRRAPRRRDPGDAGDRHDQAGRSPTAASSRRRSELRCARCRRRRRSAST